MFGSIMRCFEQWLRKGQSHVTTGARNDADLACSNVTESQSTELLKDHKKIEVKASLHSDLLDLSFVKESSWSLGGERMGSKRKGRPTICFFVPGKAFSIFCRM